MTDTHIREGVYHCPNCGAAAKPDSVRCAYCRSSLATLICSSCYGAIFTGMKHCPWCGTASSSGQPVEHAGKKCPRCEEGLLDVRVRAKVLCECPKCGGLWVDNGTLGQICTDKEQQQAVMGFDAEAPRIEGGARTQAERIYIPCPECGKLMNRRQFAGCSGVIVDWCKAHGTWFDRDELKQIVQFILAGGLTKSREREKAMLAQEKLNLKEARRNLLTISSFAALQPDQETKFLGVLGGLWLILRD